MSAEDVAKRIAGTTGANHSSWKGEAVGYRGLHYWIRRKNGHPIVCVQCGVRGRGIQWANTDGLYRRDPADYVGMCPSCHKKHDLRLKATRGVAAATR